jgi:uncharacterized flavoprotein (TIGR03862 family)
LGHAQQKHFQLAILGSGPAALMTAEVLSSAGIAVSIFEKRKSAARKLIIAGSSGLNVTYDMPRAQFSQKYSGPKPFWNSVLNQFSPDDWLKFINELGIKTFKGTSARYFVEGMKANPLVSIWKKRLTERQVNWHFNQEVVDFKKLSNGKCQLLFKDDSKLVFDAVVFCLGGASWEPAKAPIQWPQMFTNKKLGFTPFSPSNVGFNVNFSSAFLKEAEGLPLKNVILKTSRGTARGDIVITNYGLEGTPVYAIGIEGEALIDLKPDLSAKDILGKLTKTKENLAPIRKCQKLLKLSPAALALLFHETPKIELKDLRGLIGKIKAFPLKLESKQGMEWAISSSGGLQLKEVDSNFMLKKFPGFFAAGEMLDWDTVTGGFLIQACVSQGFCAGKGALDYLETLGQKPK